jgi:hypothetical protein
MIEKIDRFEFMPTAKSAEKPRLMMRYIGSVRTFRQWLDHMQGAQKRVPERVGVWATR